MARFKKEASGITTPQTRVKTHAPERVIAYYSNGQLIAQAWPRKRPRVNETTKEQNSDFSYFVAAMKLIPADMREATERIAEGSKQTWRDIASLFALGRMVDYSNYGELVAQYNLDILGDQKGMLVIRQTDEWTTLAIGTETQVLTVLNGVPAWQDAGGGEGAGIAPHPGYVSGRRYTSPLTAATSNASHTANVLRAYPFPIPVLSTLDEIVCRLSTGSAGQSIVMGVYANDAGYPGALLLDAGVISAASSGEKSVTGLAFELSPGWVWVVSLLSATLTLTTFGGATFGSALSMGFNTLVSGNAAAGHLTASQTFGTGALPDPFPAGGTWSNSTLPLVALAFT